MKPELVNKIKLLVNAAQRESEGKPFSREQKKLLEYLERSDERRTRIDFPVLETLEGTAARIGAPVMLVKTVKKSGSKAFMTGNRVDTGILVPELFAALAKGSQLPDGIASPQDWLATEKAKREQIKRQQDEGELVEAADVVRQANEAGGAYMSQLERLARELPPALAGLPSVEIAKRMEIEFERTRTMLKQKMQTIGK